MKEYKKLFNYLSETGWEEFTIFFNRGDTKNIERAIEFLDKYWLSESEFNTIWKPIQQDVFCDVGPSETQTFFRNSLEIIALKGWSLFGSQQLFENFKKFVLAIGEEDFVVIQVHPELDHPLFKIKFPSTITWDQLMSGDFISAILCGFSGGEYFIYGKTGIWGRFAANEFDRAVDLYAMEKNLVPLFKDKFNVQEAELKEVYSKWLEPKLKKRISDHNKDFFIND